MTTVEDVGSVAGHSPGFLDRERIVAGPRFNRWYVPPAALAIHLCIGMAYGISVFWLPMTRLIASAPASCAGQGFFAQLFTTTCNWTVATVTPVSEIFIAVLGISAAIWGGWLEHAGPRKAGLIAAFCWGRRLVLLAGAVWVHQLWLVYLGYGCCRRHRPGLRLHFAGVDADQMVPRPPRHGDGMAIMGFGGGALIASPLSVWLMQIFRRRPMSAWRTFIGLGVIYFIFDGRAAIFGSRPPPDWKPAG